jgi:hypothetical protein
VKTATARRKPISALYVVTGRGMVKVGISGDVESRLATHARQGLTHVTYILRSSHGEAVREFERTWKRYVRLHPHLGVQRTELKDGWTEALVLTEEVKAFIDRLVGKTREVHEED